MSQSIYLFASTFGVVFFLGFQSLSVNAGHYWLAAINSLVIGSFNLVLFKMAPQVSGPVETAAYLLGGPLAIVCAMRTHKHVAAWLNRRKTP